MQLREYQKQLIADAREALRHHRSVCLQSPTASGKTALTVHMMSSAAERGLSSMFIVHQKELLRQTSKALWEQRLEHGMIAAGKAHSILPAQVASVQTLVRRLGRYDPPRLIIIDEAHRAAASTYIKVLNAYPDAKIIGLTATPERTDGKGLSGIFDALVLGPTVRQLIDAGYLSDYEIMAPPTVVDLSDIKTSMGDYEKAQLEAAVDKPTITGDAVDHYIKFAMGRRCVVMCVSISHAKHVAEQYNANGIAAEIIYGDMTDTQREAVLVRFSKGTIKVLTNVQLMLEGVDIPAIEVIQWLRPTQSLIVWMQGNGRGMRIFPGKESLLIFDHVGNWTRHGLIDDDREWTLEGRKARQRKKEQEGIENVSIQRCPECHHLFRTGVDHCPRCGAEVEQYKPKEIQIIEGQLEKINLERERKQRRRETGRARTVREMIELGIRRGLKNPAAWAAHTVSARAGRKAGTNDFREAEKIHRAIKTEGRAVWPA